LVRPRRTALGVVEEVAELDLHVTQRPFLQDVRQAPAGRHRDARHGGLHARAVLLDVAARADRVAVLDHAEADRVGVALPVPEELDGLRRAAVGAEAPHAEGVPEEACLEGEVLVARAQA